MASVANSDKGHSDLMSCPKVVNRSVGRGLSEPKLRVVPRSVRQPRAHHYEYACISATAMEPPGDVAVVTVRQPASALAATCKSRMIS